MTIFDHVSSAYFGLLPNLYLEIHVGRTKQTLAGAKWSFRASSSRRDVPLVYPDFIMSLILVTVQRARVFARYWKVWIASFHLPSPLRFRCAVLLFVPPSRTSPRRFTFYRAHIGVPRLYSETRACCSFRSVRREDQSGLCEQREISWPTAKALPYDRSNLEGNTKIYVLGTAFANRIHIR